MIGTHLVGLEVVEMDFTSIDQMGQGSADPSVGRRAHHIPSGVRARQSCVDGDDRLGPGLSTMCAIPGVDPGAHYLSTDPLALLVGMVLDQQVRQPWSTR